MVSGIKTIILKPATAGQAQYPFHLLPRERYLPAPYHSILPRAHSQLTVTT
ncbi:MAG: hypothetical protein OIN84_10940 [Candidatus Methanoperedens sp.]|uniref:hypothetical protein n=1 Tax=Candidatus Methanoperedens sp. BLZ2 TaxID=2035255 RepID=UPI001596B80D|nr:hypothetical protein [Candidatus Methanoperedens sp. BLZ2]MBZ0174457.1 hypothetical protein [Candidatus Methanoperedens nitroreducens]MCX9078479.1 hypothetical protein [Candidatus Methanoperedens sp.]